MCPYQINDFILDFLVAQRIKEVFVITGKRCFVMDAFMDVKILRAC